MPNNHDTQSSEWLDAPVTIHFTENSILGLRRGELTKESKKYILDKLQEAQEAKHKTGFYAGQAMAGAELEDCHRDWEKWKAEQVSHQTEGEQE